MSSGLAFLIILGSVSPGFAARTANQSVDGSKCCCQQFDQQFDTPQPNVRCGLVPDSDLEENAFWKTRVCPHSQGYYDYKTWGFPEVPLRCITQEPSSTATKKGTEVIVKAYWMRHGWSCANALNEMGGMKERSWKDIVASKKFGLYADPPLTDAAIDRAVVLGKQVKAKISEFSKETPPVFSSVLVRAIETAHYNFPESTIYPIPYIKEKGKSFDNMPLKLEKQLTTRTLEEYEEIIKFDANHLDHPGRDVVDYDKFKRYFPVLLQEMNFDPPLQDSLVEVPVIIVGHSAFMRDHLQCEGEREDKGKPKNNEVWVQKYSFKMGVDDPVLEPLGCEKLFDSSRFPSPPEQLCEQDVRRCALEGFPFDMVPTAWIKRDAKTCKGKAETITDRDLAQDAPYMTSGLVD